LSDLAGNKSKIGAGGLPGWDPSAAVLGKPVGRGRVVPGCCRATGGRGAGRERRRDLVSADADVAWHIGFPQASRAHLTTDGCGHADPAG
jgi:hypothetical protein